ncbi:tyrosine-type recombinase/integrase [Pseudomonas sp. PL-6]
MKEKLTIRRLASLQVTGKEYEIHDSTVPGLFVRVTPAGSKSYLVTWARGRKKTLGRVGVMTLDQAREEALLYLNEARKHGEPLAITQGRKGAAMPSLEQFLDDHFEPWALTHQKDGANSIRAIRKSFASMMFDRLDEIDARRVERLRSGWIESGLSPATANRNLVRLKGLLSRAVEWGMLDQHPLTKVRRLKVDKRGRVRFLAPDEESRLRAALDDRQEQIRAERDSANRWREERRQPPLADLRAVAFADHLKPLVLLSLNTGMRRGEVFNLTWADVDLQNKLLTVVGDGAKSGQTRHIPLNREALAILTDWKPKDATGHVFPGKDGQRLDNVKKSWTGLLELAKVSGFRWHDLRHTFASKLVMAGVPLNTVRELLGHSDIAMTLRYAHLAPDSKAAAVELI